MITRWKLYQKKNCQSCLEQKLLQQIQNILMLMNGTILKKL